MAEPLLQVRQLEAGYADVQVLWGIDLDVNAEEITCLVGSNGAGKTTLLRTISGLLTPTGGSISFNGEDITGVPADAALKRGIAQVPEGRRLFKGLSVRDNLLLGAYLRRDGRAAVQRDLDFVTSLFPILRERRAQDASTLSGGEQQMCAIGRGIMSRPRLLMIDELSLGLAPRVMDTLIETVREINKAGISVLLVEQDVLTAFELATRAYVVESGTISRSGDTQSLANDASIREAYLGM